MFEYYDGHRNIKTALISTCDTSSFTVTSMSRRNSSFDSSCSRCGCILIETHDAVDRSLYNRMSVVTHIVIVLYSTAFWIQTGVLPFLSKKLGADPVTFGYLETVFAVAMLVGGPIFGRFGDIFGARAALVLALLSSVLTYAVLAMANGIFSLFCSRLFGFMMHALHGRVPFI